MCAKLNNEIRSRRYDGALAEVAECAAEFKDQRDALAEFTRQVEDIEHQLAVAFESSEALPTEIDKLLHSGSLDEGTVEILAKKRAHLDLIPGRIEALNANAERLQESAEYIAAFTGVKNAVCKAATLFDQLHREAAISDYMAFGVDRDIATAQADMRHDIGLDHFQARKWAETTSRNHSHKLRLLLADFDCLAAGLSPVSPGADKVRATWVKK